LLVQRQQDGTPVTAEPFRHSLLVSSWDVNHPFENLVVGFQGGWFTTQVTKTDGTPEKDLTLGIDYRDCNGKQFRAWRIGNEFLTMPMGTTAPDFDLKRTTRTRDLRYLSSDPAVGCLTARLDRAPTATGISVSGALTEGASSTLTGTASDPDGDTISLAWDF